MHISPITIQYNGIKSIKKNTKVQVNQVKSQVVNNSVSCPVVSFSALLPNSDLIKLGYRVANVENNKISNDNDSIIITSAEKFLALLNSPNAWTKKIVLTNDLDLDGREIKPIGSVQKPFRGVFDGNGCKISNFKIDCPDSRNIGLFGKCENAKILNLEVENASIKGKNQVGGIVGCAYNSEMQNCHFQGYVSGNKNIGGLIGLGNENKIESSSTLCKIDAIEKNEYNPFALNDETNVAEAIGGLVGSDKDGCINGSYSECTINANEQAGGLIGYALNSKINNSFFKGVVTGNTKCGSFIGWSENTMIKDSYALSEDKKYTGLNISTYMNRSFDSLRDIMLHLSNWSDDFWVKEFGRIPRLKKQMERMHPKAVFLEDINNDIKIGKLCKKPEFNDTVEEKIKINLSKPKHYDENNELLDKIQKSTSNQFLRRTFGELAMKLFNAKELGKNSTDKYDELFVALVQNKNMDINSTYEEDTDDLSYCYYNVWCSPLFILTCMNKAYPLKEALKREDVNFKVGSGHRHNETILNQAFTHHIDDCAYVMLTEPKMQDYISENLDNLKAKQLSAFANLMLELYPDKIPEFNEESGVIEIGQKFEIPKELLKTVKGVNSLEDVQRACEIDPNYRDSLGNNIINVASNLDNEEEALRVLTTARKIGTYIDNWNNKGETPIGHAIYTNKPHFVAQILNDTTIPYVRLADGTDAMILFSRMQSENHSINYMDIARKCGLSINSSDEDGNTPLINAINSGHVEAVKYLLANGANPNKFDNNSQTPLHHACINENIEIINLLLDTYAYTNVKDISGNLPFDYLDNDMKELFAEKFEEREVLNRASGLVSTWEPSFVYFNYDRFDRIYSLDDISARILNSEDSDRDVLQIAKNAYLIDYKIPFKDDNNNSMLHLAAQSSSPYAKECLRACIERRMDINELNADNETPLICAINALISAGTIEKQLNLIQNIKILLDAKPNVDLVDNNKQSALHKICQSGNLILFNEILKLNPKINQIDINGNTPFKYIPANANIPMYITAREYLKNNKIIKG